MLLRIYIEKDKPGAAKRLTLRIISLVEEDLVLQPGMGRPGRKSGTRELIVTGRPYLVPYRIEKDCLIVLRRPPWCHAMATVALARAGLEKVFACLSGGTV